MHSYIDSKSERVFLDNLNRQPLQLESLLCIFVNQFHKRYGKRESPNYAIAKIVIIKVITKRLFRLLLEVDLKLTLNFIAYYLIDEFSYHIKIKFQFDLI